MGPGDDAKLSPLIYALPGKLTSDGKETSGSASWSIFSGIVDYLFNTASSFLVNFIDGTNGGRCLFRMNPKTGRGLEVRGAFFGYVAMSQPAGPDKEVDVALVWRGTQFREEWESNFAADKLVSDVMTSISRIRQHFLFFALHQADFENQKLELVLLTGAV